jgi:trehalose/maltose transport system substrate-binding protein
MQDQDTPAVTRGPYDPPPKRDLPVYAIPAAIALGVIVLVVVVLVLVLGGNDDDGVASPGWLDDAPSGDVVYCSGEDVSLSQQRSVQDFNRSSASGTAHARLVEVSPKANRQREEYLDLTASSKCDVVYLDVIYSAEFAARNLLYDMTDYLAADHLGAKLDSRMMKTVVYDKRGWGVPKQLDGGVLYHRRDLFDTPRTWRRLIAAAKPDPGELPRLRLQLDAFEGLTVIFLEIAYAAGAEPIVSDDGRTAHVDQPGALKALELLQSAIRRGSVPPEVLEQGDIGSRWAFSVGRAAFLRGWPYVASRLRVDAEQATRHHNSSAPQRRTTAANLGVSALPTWKLGGEHVGILGGHNLVIPRNARNPKGALHLVDFLLSEGQVLADAKLASQAPVRSDLWDRAGVRNNPALSAVRDERLVPRPILTNYWRVSQQIYETLRRVLKTGQTTDTLQPALRQLQADVQAVLDEQG